LSKPEVVVFQSNPPHGRWRVIVIGVDLPPPVVFLDEGFDGACLFRGGHDQAKAFAAFLRRMMELG